MMFVPLTDFPSSFVAVDIFFGEAILVGFAEVW